MKYAKPFWIQALVVLTCSTPFYTKANKCGALFIRMTLEEVGEMSQRYREMARIEKIPRLELMFQILDAEGVIRENERASDRGDAESRSRLTSLYGLPQRGESRFLGFESYQGEAMKLFASIPLVPSPRFLDGLLVTETGHISRMVREARRVLDLEEGTGESAIERTYLKALAELVLLRFDPERSIELKHVLDYMEYMENTIGLSVHGTGFRNPRHYGEGEFSFIAFMDGLLFQANYEHPSLRPVFSKLKTWLGPEAPRNLSLNGWYRLRVEQEPIAFFEWVRATGVEGASEALVGIVEGETWVGVRPSPITRLYRYGGKSSEEAARAFIDGRRGDLLTRIRGRSQ